jgi:hypothetical protein
MRKAVKHFTEKGAKHWTVKQWLALNSRISNFQQENRRKQSKEEKTEDIEKVSYSNKH